MKMKLSINWRDKLPIVNWLPRYSMREFQGDLIAGVTVGLVVIPQGLAFAALAGLNPVYGLYSAFMACFVYCFFGTSKYVTIGPTAIMALLVSTYSPNYCARADFAMALSFCSGIIWLIMGFLSLGFIVRVIPLPVISGFTSSVAIIIACSQLKSLFGLSRVPGDFIPQLVKVASKLGETKIWDLILGFVCMLSLELLKRLNKIQWPSEEESPPTACQRVCRKIIWFVWIARNAIVVLASALIAVSFDSQNLCPFTLTGVVDEGLPDFKVPKFTLLLRKEFGSAFVFVPLIGFLMNIAIAQAFAQRDDYTVDPNQELIALGLANIAGSFFSAFPVTGSFSRSAINAVSGVATPLGGIFTGCIVLVTLSVLTQCFRFIPRASLASIIIMSVLHIIDLKIVKKIWQTNRIDVIPLLLTFFVCFYNIGVGIMCGCLASLMIVLYRHFLPRIFIRGDVVSHVKIDGGLTYMGADYFTRQVRKAAFLGEESPQVMVIDCASVFDCDFTVSQSFSQIVRDCSDRDIKVIFDKTPKDVKQTLVNFGVPLELFEEDPELHKLSFVSSTNYEE